MNDFAPFLVKAPALIQFSGGRTSGYMLWRILQAHGGRLPDGVIACFQNTGREHDATYRFVQRCGVQWDVPIRWIEWRPEGLGYQEVGPNSADRQGRWFATLIQQRRFLPNAVTRFCTVVLKMRAAIAFARAQGWDDWTTYIGIRADEQQRVARGRARNESGKERYTSSWPLHEAGIREEQVLAFWKEQPFDLDLPSKSFGNCVDCHLKAREKLLEVYLDDLSWADWPIAMENLVSAMIASGETKSVIVDGLFGEEEMPIGQDAARFRKHGWTYREMRDYVRDYPKAARAEVDRYYRDLAAGLAQPDLLENCMCGAGA